MTWIHQLCSLKANYTSHKVDQNCGASDTPTWIFWVFGHLRHPNRLRHWLRPEDT